MFLLLPTSTLADQHAKLAVERPWARASALGSRPGAAYLTIVNRGARADRLLDVTSPIAGHVAVHATEMSGNMMTMSAHSSLEIRPGERVEMKPGDWHLMLMDLRQPLREGQTFSLRLRFEHAGTIDVSVPIRAIGATSAD